MLIGKLFKDEVDELWPLIDALRAEDAAKVLSQAKPEPVGVGA